MCKRTPLRFHGKSSRLSVLAAFFLLLLSCSSPAIYNQYQIIDGTTWEKDMEYYFTFEITDASVPYDIFFEVRNSNYYPYRNLWIFYSEEAPVGPLRRDTMECLLADEFGKWTGKGFSLYESGFPLRTGYYFPLEGQYTFSVRQGMRDADLHGLLEIGLRIERNNGQLIMDN